MRHKVAFLLVFFMVAGIAQGAFAAGCITMITNTDVVDFQGNDVKKDWMKRPNENCKSDNEEPIGVKTVQNSVGASEKPQIIKRENTDTKTSVARKYRD